MEVEYVGTRTDARARESRRNSIHCVSRRPVSGGARLVSPALLGMGAGSVGNRDQSCGGHYPFLSRRSAEKWRRRGHCVTASVLYDSREGARLLSRAIYVGAMSRYAGLRHASVGARASV